MFESSQFNETTEFGFDARNLCRHIILKGFACTAEFFKSHANIRIAIAATKAAIRAIETEFQTVAAWRYVAAVRGSAVIAHAR